MIRAHVLICGGTGCTSSGSVDIQAAFAENIEKNGLAEEVKVVQTGCFGLCALGPVVIVYPDGTFYSRVTPEDVKEIVEAQKRLSATFPLTIPLSTKPRTVLFSETAVLSTPRLSTST